MRWELLGHTTTFSNLQHIAKDKKIKPQSIDSEFKIHECDQGVYMHYYFDKLNKEQMPARLWHWHGDVIILLNSSILKDFTFRVCPGMSFGCKNNESYMHSEKNLKRKPNMQKIQKIINNYIAIPRPSWDELSGFLQSHEVIFYDNIPIKYIECIIVDMRKDSKEFKKIQEMFPTVKIINVRNIEDDYFKKKEATEKVTIKPYYSRIIHPLLEEIGSHQTHHV